MADDPRPRDAPTGWEMVGIVGIACYALLAFCWAFDIVLRMFGR